MDIIILIAVGVVCFFAGWHLREYYAVMLMNRFVNRFERNTKEKLRELSEKTIKIKIEKHEEGYFVYNLEDHSYMAQGETRKQLEENLSKRFPGKLFAAEEENLQEVGFRHESI